MRALRVKKGDIIIVAVVLCISALVFLGLKIFPTQGSVVKIEADSEVVAELPLDENAVFNVEKDGRITNVVEIKNGSVSVISADCPDKICVNHRAISKNGESIICLPNRIIVSVEGEKEEVDGVAR